jgi:EAL domain-containing protein (putative c-di-GMP-specific phosphodiesterase class I)
VSAPGEGFAEAARAAGALAASLDPATGEASLHGDADSLGLRAASDFSGFLDQVAPADRPALGVLSRAGRVDIRIRIVGADGQVRPVRLLGQGGETGFSGLVLPAGEGGEDREEVGREAAFAAALKAGEVIAFHQPVIDLQTERLAGFEALARWCPPGGGIMAPDDFFALANRMKLMHAIGDRVRGSALADLSAWRAADPSLDRLWVSANATASELLRPGFADDLIALVGEAGVPRGRFKLEINETEVMRDPEGSEAVLLRLKAAGIGLALDDFGTGYSSLARLDRLPFDVIKIDQYFVRALIGDGASRSITASVIKLARSLGMVIVAEGVETAEMADLLAEMGCDYGQGFHYAGALPPERAGRVVTEGKEGLFGPPAQTVS